MYINNNALVRENRIDVDQASDLKVERLSSLSKYQFAILISLTILGYPFVASLTKVLEVQDTAMASIIYRGIYLALSIIILFGGLKKPKNLYSGKLWVCVIGFWGLYTYRLLNDTLINPIELNFLTPEKYFIVAYGISFIPMLAFSRRIPSISINLALYLTLVMSSIGCICVLIFKYKDISLGLLDEQDGRLGIDNLNPISIGYLGATLIVASIHVGLKKQQVVGKLFGLAILLLICLGLIIVGLSASRGPIIASAFSVVVSIPYAYKVGAKFKTIIVVCLLFILGPYMIFIISGSGSSLIERLETLGSDRDYSSEERRQSLQGAWQQFIEEPLLGSGLEEKETKSYPHNLIIESFMTTGLFGGLSLIILYTLSIKWAYQMIRRKVEYSWLVIIFCHAAINAMFSGALAASGLFWCLMMFVVQKNSEWQE